MSTFSHSGTIIVPKELNFGPKSAFLDALGLICVQIKLIESVGLGARAVSRKTPIYFIFTPSQYSFLLKTNPLACQNWRVGGIGLPGFSTSLLGAHRLVVNVYFYLSLPQSVGAIYPERILEPPTTFLTHNLYSLSLCVFWSVSQ